MLFACSQQQQLDGPLAIEGGRVGKIRALVFEVVSVYAPDFIPRSDRRRLAPRRFTHHYHCVPRQPGRSKYRYRQADIDLVAPGVSDDHDIERGISCDIERIRAGRQDDAVRKCDGVAEGQLVLMVRKRPHRSRQHEREHYRRTADPYGFRFQWVIGFGDSYLDHVQRRKNRTVVPGATRTGGLGRDGRTCHTVSNVSRAQTGPASRGVTERSIAPKAARMCAVRDTK